MEGAVHVGRYTKTGGSYGVIIPPFIRSALGFRPGDLVLMKIYGPLIIMRRVKPEMILDRQEIPANAIPGEKVMV